MSLLQRMERAQAKVAGEAAEALVPVVATGPADRVPVAPGRESLLREIRLALQSEVVAAFRSEADMEIGRAHV